jgi:hypothetical protein
MPGAPPSLTPEAPAPPPLELDQRTSQSLSQQPVPFYRKDWFWGSIGLVVLTTAIIIVASSSSGASAPSTTLGDKHAF